MKATIRHNSGGYHGHQMKDWLGGRTLCHLYGLEYVHTPYSYLANFGLGSQAPGLSRWHRWTSSSRKVSGPHWDGFVDYAEMRHHFDALLEKKNDKLIIFENAARIHPFQTIPWYEQGLIETNIFEKIQDEVTSGYLALHPRPDRKKEMFTVAIHISRGVDFNKDRFPEHFADSYNVRYMFSLPYFSNIMEQIEAALGKERVTFNLFTEALHSSEIVDHFKGRKNATVQVGSNRKEKNDQLIYDIFDQFVHSDILVCCNSSFSAMCAYYRKNKLTIYHPHKHLDHLPEPYFIKTDQEGTLLQSLNPQLIHP